MKANYNLTNAKRGAVVTPKGKTGITIYLDDEVIAGFRQQGDALGKGYQTLINEALSAALLAGSAPVTVSTLLTGFARGVVRGMKYSAFSINAKLPLK